jgi:serine protease
MKLFSSSVGLGTALLLGWMFGVSDSAIAQGARSAAFSSPAGSGTSAEPGQLVFKLKPALKAAAGRTAIAHAKLSAALAAVGVQSLKQAFPNAVMPSPERVSLDEGVDLTLVYRATFPLNGSFEAVRRALLATGVVAYVEPHYRRDLLLQPNDPLADSTLSSGQYYLKNIRAYRAWDIEQGDTTMVMGLVDTGTRFSHEDLKGQFALNYADPINGLDDDNDGYVDNFRGWDAADNDNDPSCDDAARVSQPQHGVPVGGTMAARTDNGKGIAGAGFRCRMLPIKIYPTTAAGTFGGFEGIAYAADHGCRVINCSWGGPGAYSQYEQDVITYATVNRDAVVVAAAGNTNGDLDFYPSSYQGVLAVASLDRNDIKGPTNTYAYRVSLSAPGRQILTTQFLSDSSYLLVSGSSFASPLVASAVALVRAHFPTLSAAQAAERVRVTADTSIYSLAGNANFREMLGRGRLNMRRAVGDTAVRSVRVVRSELLPNGPLYGGDTITLGADFLNYLAPLQGLSVTLTTASPWVRIMAGGPFAAGAVATMARVSNTSQPFRLALLSGAPANTVVALRFGFRDASGYRDYQYLKLILNPDFLTLDTNRLAVTVTSRGNIAFDHGDPRYGQGVTLDHHDQLLAEGGVLVGTDSSRVSDMLRADQPGSYSNDFQTIAPIRFREPLPWASQRAEGIFQDTAGATQAGVRVLQHAWANQLPGTDQTVFLEYAIINQRPDTMHTARVGFFADWDVRSAEHNVARWDAVRRLAYVFNPMHDTLFTAVKLVSPGPASTYALDNANPTALGPINATNGLTKAEKYAALLGGPTNAGTTPLGSDVAHVVSAAMPALAPHDTARVAFALIAARSLAELLVLADSTQAFYDAVQQAAPLAIAAGARRCGPGAISLTATGARSGGSYRWYELPTGGIAAPATGPTYLVTVARTDTFYVSTVTRVGRESARQPVMVVVDSVPAAPVITAAPQGSGLVQLTAATTAPVVQFFHQGVLVPGTSGNTLTLSTSLQNGLYTAVATSAQGCVSDTSASVTVVITGTRVDQLNSVVSLFPNPTSADAVLSLPTGPHRITMVDALGRRVGYWWGATGQFRLPIAKLPSGVYSVQIEDPSGIQITRRLVRN